MEHFITELLNDRYECEVEKVPLGTKTVFFDRKRKIGVKFKLFWLIPIYKYEKYLEPSNNWHKMDFSIKNRFTKNASNVRLFVCYDRKSNKLYWKYRM